MVWVRYKVVFMGVNMGDGKNRYGKKKSDGWMIWVCVWVYDVNVWVCVWVYDMNVWAYDMNVWVCVWMHGCVCVWSMGVSNG